MSRAKQSRKLDNVIISVAVVYICLPVIIFFLGWLKPLLAIVCSILLVSLAVVLIRELCQQDGDEYTQVITRSNIKFWIAVGAVTLIWVYFSGIGSFTYQNGDYWARNPIFRDLSEQSWPVIFDLSKESEIVQNICGNDKVAFSYYFCWWLPVSLLSKIFRMSSLARNTFLYLWAALGIFEIIYLLCRRLKKMLLDNSDRDGFF